MEIGEAGRRVEYQTVGWGPFCPRRWRGSNGPCCTFAGSCHSGRRSTTQWRRAWPSSGWSALCHVLSGDARLSDTAKGGGGVERGSRQREDFPLEQSRDDTLRFVFEQMMVINGNQVQPDSTLAYLYFSIIKI